MTHPPSRLCLPPLPVHLPCRLWTLGKQAPLSDAQAFAVLVHQASALPWASFPRAPRGVAVAHRLDLPSARRSTDLPGLFSCSLSSGCARLGAPAKLIGLRPFRDGRGDWPKGGSKPSSDQRISTSFSADEKTGKCQYRLFPAKMAEPFCLAAWRTKSDRLPASPKSNRKNQNRTWHAACSVHVPSPFQP